MIGTPCRTWGAGFDFVLGVGFGFRGDVVRVCECGEVIKGSKKRTERGASNGDYT